MEILHHLCVLHIFYVFDNLYHNQKSVYYIKYNTALHVNLRTEFVVQLQTLRIVFDTTM